MSSPPADSPLKPHVRGVLLAVRLQPGARAARLEGVRTLDDGGLEAAQANALARQAVERFAKFAPLYLFLGDLSNDEAEAIAAYRKGLELVEEPDLESRLLCALAGRLPIDSPERKELVERAVMLDGSLVALATARLMDLQ